MKTNIKSVLAIVLLVAFALLGLISLHHTQELKAQYDVKLQSNEAKLNTLKLDYKSLNQSLTTELDKKQTSEKRVKELEKDKANLEKRERSLQSQLQAKLDKKNAEKVALQKAQQSLVAAVLPASTASAAPVSSNVAKAFIYAHESGNRTDAINASSGACGLGQALPCSKMGCSLADYACQDAYFTGYMASRYGTWENAMGFWQSHGWW